jgi:hypothetical protein
MISIAPHGELYIFLSEPGPGISMRPSF